MTFPVQLPSNISPVRIGTYSEQVKQLRETRLLTDDDTRVTTDGDTREVSDLNTYPEVIPVHLESNITPVRIDNG